jgi:hypothetical protein
LKERAALGAGVVDSDSELRELEEGAKETAPHEVKGKIDDRR